MLLNVLVVDDSPIIRKMVRRALSMSGLPLGEVYEASDGAEALGLLGAHAVDVVFADINMPNMTGVEMVEKMAAEGMLPRIPVIIVSTERSQRRIDHLKRLGVRTYLHKPFRPESFRNLVSDALEMEVPLGT